MIKNTTEYKIYPGETKYRFFTGIILFELTLSPGCSSMSRIDRYRPIMGHWETGRNIIVSIRETDDYGVGAFVMETPGYMGPEAKVNTPIIINIKPYAHYSYEGMFLMPGGNDPVNVQMILTGRNTLAIISRDKRVQNRMMQWNRARKPR